MCILYAELKSERRGGGGGGGGGHENNILTAFDPLVCSLISSTYA